MTFKFIVPYTGQSITFISLSGLPFSPLLPQTTPSAFCSVNDLLPSINSNSVRFILTNALAELTMSFEAPGLPVGSGPFGVGMLSVTCKVSNLVNAPVAADVRPIASAVVFGINDAPLYFQSGFKFPALFVQSLGFKRPRVSCEMFFYVLLLFLHNSFIDRSLCQNIWHQTLASRSRSPCDP